MADLLSTSQAERLAKRAGYYSSAAANSASVAQESLRQIKTLYPAVSVPVEEIREARDESVISAQSATQSASQAVQSADSANISANSASSSADSAGGDASRAEQARDAAEDALSAATVAGRIYPDEPTGRAAVADGDYFFTESEDPLISYVMWRKVDTNTSQFIAEDPDAQYVEQSVQRTLPAVRDYNERENAYKTLDGETVGMAYAITDRNGRTALAIDNDGKVHQIRENEEPDAVAENVEWAMVDNTGQVALGIRKDGRVILERDNEYIPQYTDFMWGVADLAGRVALGVQSDGTVFFNGIDKILDSDTPSEFAIGAKAGVLRRVDIDGNAIDLTAPSFTAYGESYESPTVTRFIYDETGADRMYLYDDATGGITMVPRGKVLKVMIGIGQSLSVGGGQQSVATPEDATVSNPPRPYGKNCLMLETGVRGFGSGARTKSYSFAAAYEVYNGPNLGETPGTGAMERAFYDAVTSDKDTYLFRATGRSGTPYSGLKKGSAVYANSLADVQEITDIAASMGWSVEVVAMVVTHGEADRNQDNPDYLADLIQWRTDYQTDIPAITGQSTPPVFLVDQLANEYETGVTGSQIIQDFYDFAEMFDDVYLSCPKYHMENIDNVHLVANGYRRLGEYHGRALNNVLNGAGWEPLKPISITRTGAVIDIVTNASTQLVLDTTMAPSLDTVNYGFHYSDDSSSATISTVEIVGLDTVRITLDAIPAGANKTIDYAFTNRFGHLRDSGDGMTLAGDPRPLYNAGVCYSITFEA